ncbi:MAG: TIGR02301 family protein [Oceanicaulis sp.]
MTGLIRVCAAALAAVSLCAGTAGARQEATETYPVEALAGVLGELHFIQFKCEGRNAQLWRETMLELLELEAPTRGALRDRLIETFNAGFRAQQRRDTRCGAEAEVQSDRLSARGRSLSEQLRRTYLE